MPQPIAKPGAAELVARGTAVSDGNARLDAFLTEFRGSVAPLLSKHGLEIRDQNLLHHRSATDRTAYAVLHFYVYAPPPVAGDGDAAHSKG